MKTCFVLLSFLISFNALCQEDSLPPKQPVSLCKNQLVWHLNPFTNNEDGPYFGIEYRRLRKKDFYLTDSETRENFSQYWAVSAEFSGFQKPTVLYKDQFLKTISDTAITLRVSGNGSTDYNLKFGIENQQRIFSLPNSLSGLQMVVGYYGILGITKKTEQYVEATQEISTSQQTGLENNMYTGQFPIAGQRLSDYLRIGGGAFLGFDFLMGFSTSKTILVGLNFGFLNLSGAFLTKSTTVMDPDSVYSEKPDSFYVHYDMNFHLRFGITF